MRGGKALMAQLDPNSFYSFVAERKKVKSAHKILVRIQESNYDVLYYEKDLF